MVFLNGLASDKLAPHTSILVRGAKEVASAARVAALVRAAVPDSIISAPNQEPFTLMHG